MVLFGNYTLSNASNFAQMRFYMKLLFVATPFYPKLDENQRAQAMAIVQNIHLTLDQLGKELIQWAKKIPDELQKEIEEFGYKFLELMENIDDRVRTYVFSPNSGLYGEKIKEINTRHDITLMECDKLTAEVIDSAPPHIQQELARFMFWMEKEYVDMIMAWETLTDVKPW